MSRPDRPRIRPGAFDYHEEVELTIVRIDSSGEGIGEAKGTAVHIPFVLPGEKVRARVFRNMKTHSEADLVAILDPHPERIAQPVCPQFGTCSGCQFQHATYSWQLEWKRGEIARLLREVTEVEFPVQPVVASPQTVGYRSKLTPHFEKPSTGDTLAIGFLKHGSSHNVIDIPHCPIATDAINQALPSLRTLAQEKSGTYKRGATLLLRDCVEGVVTDPKQTVTERVGDLSFRFVAGEFFQNNPFLLERFAGYVTDKIKASGVRHVVDAYCGCGFFSLHAARAAAQVQGIEVSERAVALATENAALNNISNVTFTHGDASAIFAAVQAPPSETAVILDPPRKGCSESFLQQLVQFAPALIISVACGPESQMRDIRLLLAAGYRIQEVQPFDLFPQTRHIENIIVLERG